MVILENIDIDIDIDKAILQNIDIDKISNRFKFGISNRACSQTFASCYLFRNQTSAPINNATRSPFGRLINKRNICNFH